MYDEHLSGNESRGNESRGNGAPSNPIRSNHTGHQYIHSRDEQDTHRNEQDDSSGKQNAHGNDADHHHSRPHRRKPEPHERKPNPHERKSDPHVREPDDYDQEPNAHPLHQDHPPTGIKRRTQNAGNELTVHHTNQILSPDNIIRERILEKVLDHQKLKEDFHALFVITIASLSINLLLLFQVFKYM